MQETVTMSLDTLIDAIEANALGFSKLTLHATEKEIKVVITIPRKGTEVKEAKVEAEHLEEYEGDSLPYPRVTREQLDRELDEIQRQRRL